MPNPLRRSLFALPFLALLAGAVLHGQDEEGDKDPALVGGKVSYFRGSGGGNVGIQVGEDGVLVVDDKFENTTEEVAAAIRDVAGAEPDFLVNTHHHGDHTGGNAVFGKTATILAQANVRRRLEEEGHADLLPTITYEEGLTLHYNGEAVRLIHFEHGHTDGDSVVWFTGSKVIHMGDLYFQVGYPFVDIGAGGSVQGILAAVDRVLELVPEDTLVIPGHGIAGDLAELRAYRDMLQTVVERVTELAGEDFSLDDMMDVGVTEEFDERWNWEFIPARKFVEEIVAGLDS